MKRLTFLFAAILLSTGVVFSTPAHEGHDHGTKATASAPKEVEVVGHISDSSCGLHHMEGMGDEKSCTLMCVKGGSKFVLADRDHKVVYSLDKVGQEKAREFAGQKVKVTGRVTGKTIRVTKIEAA
ncbi:MAG: hypothetical protein DMF67_01765 [Acidobacteria bacterium]|nr:MAG: hypothetical protein DMF67_01765 [Acidobacteriota bacterium]